MARTVVIFELNFIIWGFLALQFSGRNGFNILPGFIGIVVGATIGFFGISWRLKPLDSKGELTGSRKDLVFAAIVIIAGVYLLIYPSSLATLTVFPEVTGVIEAVVAGGWGGYVLAFLRWERIHEMDIVSEGKWGSILRAVPKHPHTSNQRT